MEARGRRENKKRIKQRELLPIVSVIFLRFGTEKVRKTRTDFGNETKTKKNLPKLRSGVEKRKAFTQNNSDSQSDEKKFKRKGRLKGR